MFWDLHASWHVPYFSVHNNTHYVEFYGESDHFRDYKARQPMSSPEMQYCIPVVAATLPWQPSNKYSSALRKKRSLSLFRCLYFAVII